MTDPADTIREATQTALDYLTDSPAMVGKTDEVRINAAVAHLRAALAALTELEQREGRDRDTIAHYTRSLDAAEADRDRLQRNEEFWRGQHDMALAEAQRTRDEWAETENALRADRDRLADMLREVVDYLEEQDAFPTSDGHPLYAARAALDPSLQVGTMEHSSPDLEES